MNLPGTNTKCLICGCRLINWTWKSKHCTICLDQIERRKYYES